MEPGAATKLIATLCGLAGFCVACLAGLSASNRATLVLWQSVMSLTLCYAVGSVLGAVGESTVRAHMKRLEAALLPGEPGAETHSNIAKTPQNQEPATSRAAAQRAA